MPNSGISAMTAGLKGRQGILNLGRPPKIGLLGDGIGLYRAAKWLQSNGFEICGMVSDHPQNRHEADVSSQKAQRGLTGGPEVFADETETPFERLADLNAPEAIDCLVRQGAELLLCFGPRTIFKGPILDRFAERLLNFHTAPLPQYRGGASDSWMILNGESAGFGVCHSIDSGIDSGPIWATADYDIPRDALPLDIYERRLGIVGALVAKALKNYLDAAFEPKPQKAEDGFYLPKLFTPRDGGIDWSRSPEENARFIRAFSLPYSGAWSYCRGQRINIRRARVWRRAGFHSFADGLIIGRTERGWRAVSGGGEIEIWDMDADGKSVERLLGKRMHPKTDR